MIDTIYLEIIILMFSINIFGGKIFPQMLNMFLTIAMLLNQISISTDLQSNIGIFLIYGAVVIYAAMQIMYSKNEINNDGE